MSQQLHTVPNRTWVRLVEEGTVPPAAPEVNTGQRIFFDHIDGMYSFCKTEAGDIVHLVAWQEVTIDEDQD